MNIVSNFSTVRMDTFSYPAGSTLGPRLQSTLQLFYIYSGSAEIVVGDCIRTVNKGEITLLLPGEMEYFRFSGTEKTLHGYCCLYEAKLTPEQRETYFLLKTPVQLPEEIVQLTRRAAALRYNPHPAAQALYTQLALTAFYEFFYATAVFSKHPASPEPVEKAKRFISEKFAGSIDLDKISRAAGITPTHLIRLFKKHLGLTPMQYLWQVRIQHGMLLLRETGLNIASIAYDCGFQAPHHFSRLFKKQEGMTPTVYRLKMCRRSFSGE